MPFIKKDGVPGMIYVPECKGCDKKHDCPDCFACQWCDENRCKKCMKRRNNSGEGEDEKEK